MNDDRERARALMARAEKLLKAVDDSYIIKERGHHPRPMPSFKHTEIELGRTLGAGGFGIVNEITAFDLEPQPELSKDGDEEAKQEEGAEKKAEGEEEKEENKAGAASTATNDLYEDDSHYHIDEARDLMNKKVLRRGVTRYALKRLHDNLSEFEKARAMIDLAIEAKYLSVVWHPNIGGLFMVDGGVCDQFLRTIWLTPDTFS
jgi:hypothetical protein